MSNVHQAFVTSMLNGGAPVKMGGSLVAFQPMGGEGWFSDKAKSLWGAAKNLFHQHVKPVLIDNKDKIAQVVKDTARNAASAALKADGTLGSIKAGLNSVKSDVGKQKDVLKKQLIEKLNGSTD